MAQKSLLFDFPWVVLLAALALTGVGLLGIHSVNSSPAFVAARAAAALSGESLNNPVRMQILWLALSLVVVLVMVWPSYLKLGKLSYLLYGLALAMLLMLLASKFSAEHFGQALPFMKHRNHAYSWFQIPGTNNGLQPSELMKIAFIMALARYLTYSRTYRQARGLVAPFLMALIPTALVIQQPDLGTALMFVPVLVLMLFAAGAKVRHLLAILLVVLALAPAFYLMISSFQQRRVDTWLLADGLEDFHLNRQQALRQSGQLTAAQQQEMIDGLRGSLRVRLFLAADHAKWWTGRRLPRLFGSNDLRLTGYYDRPYTHQLYARGPDESLDSRFLRTSRFVENWLKGPGYQPWQAKVAVGAGGLTGAGLAGGSQTQNNFLAEAQNDFLFAVLSEEWGFIGSLIVIGLYLVIVVCGVDVGLSTNEPYGKLLAVGVVAMLASQAFLNIAINIGLAPVTGIPLPLMSYGGSSLLSSYVALALLCNVGLRRYVIPEPQPFTFKN